MLRFTGLRTTAGLITRRPHSVAIQYVCPEYGQLYPTPYLILCSRLNFVLLNPPFPCLGPRLHFAISQPYDGSSDAWASNEPNDERYGCLRAHSCQSLSQHLQIHCNTHMFSFIKFQLSLNASVRNSLNNCTPRLGVCTKSFALTFFF